MDIFREQQKEFEFDSKEHGKAFEVLLNNSRSVRIQGQAKLRKSLPKFKGHKNPRWSVFVTAWALPDAAQIIKLAVSARGYDPCKF